MVYEYKILYWHALVCNILLLPLGKTPSVSARECRWPVQKELFFYHKIIKNPCTVVKECIQGAISSFNEHGEGASCDFKGLGMEF